MPPLRPEVREALVESIKAKGIIQAVVKDQTGYVLDGHNRITIAQELGLSIPETVFECEPDMRDITSIELNGARRQMSPKDWKPLVDHLRSQVNSNDQRRHSDRAIATAVGISKGAISRYKSPISTTAPGGAVITSTIGQDGKVRVTGGDWTASDRILHLIRQSRAGLTTEDLARDSVLGQFARSSISQIPGTLRDQGLVQADGKRGRSIIWIAAAPGAPPPAANPILDRKVEKVTEAMADPDVRAAIKDGLTTNKQGREVAQLLKEVEKEEAATIAAREKQEAEEEKERLRMIEVARNQADKSLKTWNKLVDEVRGAWVIIAAYSKVFDDLPPLHSSYVRRLDRELIELRQQMEWFDRRLHPLEERGIRKGVIIDIKS
jgi:hypothetical protein